MKNLFLIPVFILLLFSCKKENVTKTPGNPSTDYLNFKLNNTLYNVDDHFVNTLSGGYMLIDTWNGTADGSNKDEEFRIHLSGITLSTTSGTYVLDTISGSMPAISYISITEGSYSSKYAHTQGTITITSIDHSTKRIKGTFSGRMALSDGTNEKVVTEGDFDLPFN
jgi:hypothetical protein